MSSLMHSFLEMLETMYLLSEETMMVISISVLVMMSWRSISIQLPSIMEVRTIKIHFRMLEVHRRLVISLSTKLH